MQAVVKRQSVKDAEQIESASNSDIIRKKGVLVERSKENDSWCGQRWFPRMCGDDHFHGAVALLVDGVVPIVYTDQLFAIGSGVAFGSALSWLKGLSDTHG